MTRREETHPVDNLSKEQKSSINKAFAQACKSQERIEENLKKGGLRYESF